MVEGTHRSSQELLSLSTKSQHQNQQLTLIVSEEHVSLVQAGPQLLIFPSKREVLDPRDQKYGEHSHSPVPN